MKDDTYSAYERRPEGSKATPLKDQRAAQFGKKFKVSWTWLLTGDGSPFDTPLTPEEARVVAAMRKRPEDQERIATAVELLTGTDS